MASGCWDQSRHNGVKDISDLLCMYVVHRASAALGLLLFGNLQWISVKSKCHDIGDNLQLHQVIFFVCVYVSQADIL